MIDIPKLPLETTAFQKGKELFDKGLAKGFNVTPGSDYLFQETRMAVAYHMSLDNIEHLDELENELRATHFNVKREVEFIGIVKNPFIPEIDDYLWETEPSVKESLLYQEIPGKYKIEPTFQHVLVVEEEAFEKLIRAVQYLRQIALWKVPDIRIVGVLKLKKVYSFVPATAYFAENSEKQRVIVLKKRRFRHPGFANLGKREILVDRRFSLQGYLD